MIGYTYMYMYKAKDWYLKTCPFPKLLRKLKVIK